MSGADSRVVTMKFDNAAFESNAKTSLSTLDKLKASMKFDGTGSAASKNLTGISGLLAKFSGLNPFSKSTEGLTDLQSNANRFSLAPVEGAVTGVSKSFIALTTLAVTALSTIASKAVSSGLQLVKSFTFAPVTSGLQEYETTLNSIQTIMANTGLKGDTGLDTVNAALQQLNTYSDKTIYNFSQMARNIGTFTAAGINLDTSVAAIKGIANLAAVSGSNADQASTVMYQLSQALATGTVKLMDWNSVVNAGMGGKVFQESLKDTARAHGIAVDDIIKDEGSFRDSLQTGWLTSDVLTETLSKFTGDLNARQLKTMGYTDKQIKGILEMGKTAQDAATKVKTMHQLIDTLQEAMGSGWTKSFQLIFGNFNEARDLFTNVNNVLGGIVGRSAAARNKILGDWNKLGGRQVLIDAISNAWKALGDVLKPIKDAFREIFPAKTGRDLWDMTAAFLRFTEGLKISKDTAANLKSTFAGVFAVFDILGQVVVAIAHQFGRLFNAIGDGSGGFLEFTGGIGDALVAFDDFLKKSGGIESFFQNIGDYIAIPFQLLKQFVGLIVNLFSSFDTGGVDKVGGAFETFGKSLSPLQKAGQIVHNVFEKISGFLSNIGTTIGNALLGLGDLIAGAITPETFTASLHLINTALLGGIVLMVKNFFNKGITVDAGGGLFASIKNTLSTLTDTLKTMQAQVKADIILKIAAAMAILTASLLVLSLIEPKALVKALIAMGVGFAALSATLIILSNSVALMGAVKITAISLALVALATAMLILAGAVKLMASIDLGDMLRGITGIALVLLVISKAMSSMPKGILLQAAALLILSVALNAIAGAVMLFATMDWAAMGKGLAGVAGSLIVIAVAMRLMPKGILLQAAALLILSVALSAIAAAVILFSTMDWENIGKGLVGLGGSLVVIAAAMQLMPTNMVLTGPALIAVGIAIGIIGQAVKSMSKMGWEQIAKGLVTLAGALAIIAGGMYLMSGALPGAAALVIVAGALAILTPVLITLGSLEWETILKGLAALAGIFVVLGLAGLILSPLVPVLLGLAVALVLIGAGLALAGVGALAFATAFGIVVATGAAGIGFITDLLQTVVDSIPGIFQALGLGIVGFVQIIADSGPQFVQAMGKIIGNLLQAVIDNIPKIGQVFLTLIHTGLNVLREAIPDYVDAGLDILVGVLTGIRNHIGQVVTVVGDIIVEFITALGNKIGDIISAGVKFIENFINGLANAIRTNAAGLGAAYANLGLAIVEGVVAGIWAAGGAIKDALMSLAHDAWDAAIDFIKPGSPSHLFRDTIGKPISQGIAWGISRDAHMSVTAIEDLGNATLDKMKETMQKTSDAFKMEADMSPRVSPVLDLSQLTQDAHKMGGILAQKPLNATLSYQQASDISAQTLALQTMALETQAQPQVQELKFEQNNYSPKAISPVDIYRSTRNQLAFAKEALAR